jgi:nicotinamide-nucleotide amidase
VSTKKQVEEIIQLLNDRNESVATAESLTAGGLSQTLTSVSGSSTAFIGGLTAYRNEIKVHMLGVDASTITNNTVVSEAVAMEMAKGAKQQFATTWAIATTGVAGPEPLEGHAPGEVWIAIAGPINQAVQLTLEGSRDVIREATIASAIGTFYRILKYRGV